MLTRTEEGAAGLAPAAFGSGLNATSETARRGIASDVKRSPIAKALRVEWLGQTAASICWIGSVLAYGISSSGDWLQLCAASAWLLANIAAIATAEAD